MMMRLVRKKWTVRLTFNWPVYDGQVTMFYSMSCWLVGSRRDEKMTLEWQSISSVTTPFKMVPQKNEGVKDIVQLLYY